MQLFYACSSSTYFEYRGNSRRSQLHVLEENNTRFVNEGFIVITIYSEHSRGNKTKGYGLSFNCDNEYTVVLCNNLYFVYCTRKICMVTLIFDFCLLYHYRINRYFIMLHEDSFADAIQMTSARQATSLPTPLTRISFILKRVWCCK